MAADSAASWRNLPAKSPEQSSAGVCGMHGCFVGPACPKCVTQTRLAQLKTLGIKEVRSVSGYKPASPNPGTVSNG